LRYSLHWNQHGTSQPVKYMTDQ